MNVIPDSTTKVSAPTLVGRDGLDGRSVDVCPQLHHAGVGCPPRIGQRLEYGFSDPHPQRPMAFRAPTPP